MAVIVNEEKCTGCGNCANVCPVEAIIIESKARIKENDCLECGTCVDECPEGALSIV